MRKQDAALTSITQDKDHDADNDGYGYVVMMTNGYSDDEVGFIVVIVVKMIRKPI